MDQSLRRHLTLAWWHSVATTDIFLREAEALYSMSDSRVLIMQANCICQCITQLGPYDVRVLCSQLFEETLLSTDLSDLWGDPVGQDQPGLSLEFTAANAPYLLARSSSVVQSPVHLTLSQRPQYNFRITIA